MRALKAPRLWLFTRSGNLSHAIWQRAKAEDDNPSVRMLIDLVDNKLSCLTNDAFEEWVCENAAQNVSDCQLTGGRFTVRQFFARLCMRAVWAAVAEQVH
jgi:hypothetical protein